MNRRRFIGRTVASLGALCGVTRGTEAADTAVLHGGEDKTLSSIDYSGLGLRRSNLSDFQGDVKRIVCDVVKSECPQQDVSVYCHYHPMQHFRIVCIVSWWNKRLATEAFTVAHYKEIENRVAERVLHALRYGDRNKW